MKDPRGLQKEEAGVDGRSYSSVCVTCLLSSELTTLGVCIRFPELYSVKCVDLSRAETGLLLRPFTTLFLKSSGPAFANLPLGAFAYYYFYLDPLRYLNIAYFDVLPLTS